MFSASRTENENAEGTLLEMKLGTAGGCPKQQDSERVAHHGQRLVENVRCNQLTLLPP